MFQGMQPKLPNGLTIGSAITGDDRFFHSFLQCIQQVKPGKTFSIKTLRINCKNFAKKNVNQDDSWIKELLDNNHALPCIEEYVTQVEFTSDDIVSPKAAALHLQKAIPGCPEIDGRILCNVYNVKLHVIEKHIVHGKTYFLDLVVDSFVSKHSNDIQYEESDVVHVLQEEVNKYLPILRTHKSISSDSSDGEEAANVLNSKLFKVMCSKNSEDLKIAKMKALLMKGADIDFKDGNNKCNTVLHIAIRKREIKVIGFLVKINADIHIKNSEGISALEYAEHLEKSDIVDILNKRIVCTMENEDIRPHRDNVENTKRNKQELNDKYNMKKSSIQRPTFRRGISPGATGHDFEIQLLTLFKLHGEQQITNLYSAGNHAKAESFDDVVFQYWNDKRESKIIFPQAKHRDDENIRKINFTTFRTDKNFELCTYFDSYLKVRKAFKDDENDSIFKGSLKEQELFICHFY